MFRGGSISLGKIYGATIRVGYSWLILVLLFVWTFGADYFPTMYPEWSAMSNWSMAVLVTLLFVGSLFLHELAHVIFAIRRGISVSEMTLHLFGGLSRLEREPATPGDEFWIAFAGPAASLVLGGILFLGAFVSPWAHIEAVLRVSGGLSLTLGVFNLLPGFPLDGGRIFRAAVWAIKNERETATRWASRLGQVISMLMTLLGIGFVFLGRWLDGLWLLSLSMILNRSSRMALTRSTIEALLSAHLVAEVMDEGGLTVPPQLTLDVLVEQYMARGRVELAVGHPESVLGTVNAAQVRDVPNATWKTSRVQDIMTALSDENVITPDTGLWSALQRMAIIDLTRVPVILDNKLVGILERDRVLRFLNNLQFEQEHGQKED